MPRRNAGFFVIWIVGCIIKTPAQIWLPGARSTSQGEADMTSITPEVKYVEVTPQYANELLDKYTPAFQRNANRKVVDTYSEQMENGKWDDWSEIEFANIPNATILVNGQHRLLAVLKSGTTQKFIFIYKTMSYEECVRHYGKLDGGYSRNSTDAIRAYDPFPIDLTKADKIVLMAATRMIGAEFARGHYKTRKSLVDRIDDANLWADEYKIYKSATAGSEIVDRMEVAPYLSVSLYVIRHCEKMATEFVKLIAGGSHGSPTNPTRRAREFIIASSSSKGYGGSATLYRLRNFAHFWNCYYDGREIKSVRLPNDFFIAGTPKGQWKNA